MFLVNSTGNAADTVPDLDVFFGGPGPDGDHNSGHVEAKSHAWCHKGTGQFGVDGIEGDGMRLYYDDVGLDVVVYRMGVCNEEFAVWAGYDGCLSGRKLGYYGGHVCLNVEKTGKEKGNEKDIGIYLSIDLNIDGYCGA